jgi:hypothetical protein
MRFDYTILKSLYPYDPTISFDYKENILLLEIHQIYLEIIRYFIFHDHKGQLIKIW